MIIPLLALAAAYVQDPAPASQAPAPPAVSAPARFYGVIFEVDTDDKGKVAKLAVARVMDASSGTPQPVQLTIPEGFIAATKTQLLARDYPANKHFFTYNFFDPQRPDKADIDPKTEPR